MIRETFQAKEDLVPITPAAITTAALFHLSPTMIRAIVKSTGALVLIPTAVLDTTIPTMIQEITDATPPWRFPWRKWP
jgi:hypothetical protein